MTAMVICNAVVVLQFRMPLQSLFTLTDASCYVTVVYFDAYLLFIIDISPYGLSKEKFYHEMFMVRQSKKTAIYRYFSGLIDQKYPWMIFRQRNSMET